MSNWTRVVICYGQVLIEPVPRSQSSTRTRVCIYTRHKLANVNTQVYLQGQPIKARGHHNFANTPPTYAATRVLPPDKRPLVYALRVTRPRDRVRARA